MLAYELFSPPVEIKIDICNGMNSIFYFLFYFIYLFQRHKAFLYILSTDINIVIDTLIFVFFLIQFVPYLFPLKKSIWLLNFLATSLKHLESL